MAQKYQELSDKIVGLVGGKANVQFFTHCVTRLRFNVKDESAVKKEERLHRGEIRGREAGR